MLDGNEADDRRGASVAPNHATGSRAYGAYAVMVLVRSRSNATRAQKLVLEVLNSCCPGQISTTIDNGAGLRTHRPQTTLHPVASGLLGILSRQR